MPSRHRRSVVVSAGLHAVALLTWLVISLLPPIAIDHASGVRHQA